MFDKKKLHFWQLVLAFGIITIMGLALSYGYERNSEASMMGSDMENMMGSTMASMMGMHLENVTVADLIRQEERTDTVMGEDAMASHHQAGSGLLNTIHIITTSAIVLLLPLIIAGALFLAVVWIK